MHQPLYKDPMTGEYTMPWVLFHGTKDYYDMAAILEEFPDVHQTFNVVPCLIEQINEYGSGKALDAYRKISAKAAADLTRDDKVFMLRFFFQANWDNMIRPVHRYWELLKKRGVSNAAEDIPSVLRYFHEQDYLDLQVLFNLVWIDPEIRKKDPFLSGLYQKGGSYTETEKQKLLDKQTEIMNMILPKYAELKERGIIEVSTTPYYHPIMPLLCDSYSAKEAMPNAVLPKERFIHPEDAQTQLRKGVELYKDTFGHEPKGLWPSEGSVSMEILPLVAEQGFRWLATDEEILSNTIKRPIRRDHYGHCYDTFLYKPYTIEAAGRSLSIVFRDHVLSDLIGFDYAKMDAHDAANDFIGRLTHIYNMLEKPQEHIVSIILDGENAWENFKDDGRDFFVALYSKLSNNPKLRCVTVNEFLNEHNESEPLNWLYPGSWISHNFKIWIGHHEDNTAWDYITEARAALVSYEESVKGTPEYKKNEDNIKAAWEEIYATEGSDWFWWYGEEHSSMSDETFDTLFRLHIKKIYQLIEMEPPEYLEMPITTGVKGFRPASEPQAYLNPVIDGAVTNYFEWLSAGRIEREFFGTAMHKELKGSGLISGISYGFSKEKVFFRFDYHEDIKPFLQEWTFSISFLHPSPVKVNATIKGKESKCVVLKKDNNKWTESGISEICSEGVVELAIPFNAIGVNPGDDISLFFTIDAGERGIERWPVKGFLILQTPSEDFEQQNWIV